MVRLSFNNRERPEKPWRRDCLVVSLAVGIIGVTFGVFAESAGFGLAEIFVMSALVFTGASQFAAVGVVEGGGSGGAAVGSALLLATRNALYGPVVRRVLPKARVARLASAHFVIDETAAMSVSQANLQASRDAFWFTGVLLWLLWNAGSLAGAVIGSALSSPETLGLDAAFPAIYLALIAGHVRTFAGRVAAICAALITLASLPFVASGLPILLSVLALVPAMFALRRPPPASATLPLNVGEGEPGGWESTLNEVESEPGEGQPGGGESDPGGSKQDPGGSRSDHSGSKGAHGGNRSDSGGGDLDLGEQT